jgi:hypothetical protein
MPNSFDRSPYPEAPRPSGSTLAMMSCFGLRGSPCRSTPAIAVRDGGGGWRPYCPSCAYHHALRHDRDEAVARFTAR